MVTVPETFATGGPAGAPPQPAINNVSKTLREQIVAGFIGNKYLKEIQTGGQRENAPPVDRELK